MKKLSKWKKDWLEKSLDRKPAVIKFIISLFTCAMQTWLVKQESCIPTFKVFRTHYLCLHVVLAKTLL